MLQHEHTGVDTHGGSWNECIHKVGTRIVGPRKNLSLHLKWFPGHARTAKFSLIVAVISSFMVGLVLSAILLATQDIYPSLFSSDSSVQALVKELTPVLALCIIINNFQLVLLGVAVGAGWQAAVAYVNIACYYLFGVPLGLIFGFKLNWGVKEDLQAWWSW
ncbi:protein DETOXIFICATION 29-like isoform X2 [Eucalyptus grandis]|uniref:protein DETOXIFICATION 29-like isoform X2 n=1 Tax=Eucalyptus grandis TaxID=71139 RepID=UPI00192E8092|nr:protein DETOXIFICATION 29-like isoform X2 [Eucalyptus grandis]